ncbi:MAG: hypothetical protein ACI4J6_02095 [Oscillospiraceae bacterium]
MKRCEQCGAEYGDDGLFCPYCDERYGTVMRSNDVVSCKFPPFSPENVHYAGYTKADNVSFYADREKIYRRNVRLAAVKKYSLKKSEQQKQFDLIKIHSRFNNIIKWLVRYIVLCVVLFVTSLGVWFVCHKAAQFIEDKKQRRLYEEYLANNVTESETYTLYGKNGAEMTVEKSSVFSFYTFVYTNTTDEPVFHFAELFSGSDDLENAADMLIIYPSGARGAIEWEDGVPDISEENVYISVLENRQLEIDEWRTIEPGETASGYLYIGGLRKS